MRERPRRQTEPAYQVGWPIGGGNQNGAFGAAAFDITAGHHAQSADGTESTTPTQQQQQGAITGSAVSRTAPAGRTHGHNSAVDAGDKCMSERPAARASGNRYRFRPGMDNKTSPAARVGPIAIVPPSAPKSPLQSAFLNAAGLVVSRAWRKIRGGF